MQGTVCYFLLDTYIKYMILVYISAFLYRHLDCTQKHADFKFMRGDCVGKRTELSKAVCVRGFDTVVCDGSGSGPGGSPLEIKYFR